MENNHIINIDQYSTNTIMDMNITYNKMTINELKKKTRELEIENRSQAKTKKDMILLIQKHNIRAQNSRRNYMDKIDAAIRSINNMKNIDQIRITIDIISSMLGCANNYDNEIIQFYNILDAINKIENGDKLVELFNTIEDVTMNMIFDTK